MPEVGKIHQFVGVPSAFTPDYSPEEMFEIAEKLYKNRDKQQVKNYLPASSVDGAGSPHRW